MKTPRALLAGFVFAVMAMLAPLAMAVDPDEMLGDPVLEQRARALSSELRCVVCQNQSIDDSDAPLAKDLRRLVRDRLAAGDSDAEVKDYLVNRYGTFVLLRPPVQSNTILLWALPFLICAIALWCVYAQIWSRRVSGPTDVDDGADLTTDEKRRLEAVLSETENSSRSEQ